MISGDPSYGEAEYKHMCSIWVCVSIFHNNDYGSSRRSSHTKHSDTRKEFAREAQTFGITELVYVPTEEQPADGMTKALPNLPFWLSVLTIICTTMNFLPTGLKESAKWSLSFRVL